MHNHASLKPYILLLLSLFSPFTSPSLKQTGRRRLGGGQAAACVLLRAPRVGRGLAAGGRAPRAGRLGCLGSLLGSLSALGCFSLLSPLCQALNIGRCRQQAEAVVVETPLHPLSEEGSGLAAAAAW